MLQNNTPTQPTDFKEFINEFRSIRKERPDMSISKCLDSLLSHESSHSQSRGSTSHRA